MTESVTPEMIGRQNRRAILECVRKHGPITRAELHRRLHMSSPTVSANVKRLLEQNYLTETGDRSGSIGRKAALLEFNARRCLVAGVDIGRANLRTMLADLSGNELGYREVPLRAEAIGEQICEMLKILLDGAGEDAHALRCIGLGIPGIREENPDRVRLAPYLPGFQLSSILKKLSDAFDAAVLVENSVKYGAIGEKWQGIAQGYRNIVYINYGVGIGSALILNGELYRGSDGAAGEIGFMTPRFSPLREQFDERGALEALVSGERIRSLLIEQGFNGDVRNALERASGDVARMLEDLVDAVGAMLVNVTAVFNEEIIVLGGGLGDVLGERFISEWTRILSNHVPYVPRLVRSNLRERANVLGAVAASMRHVNDGNPAEESRSSDADSL